MSKNRTQEHNLAQRRAAHALGCINKLAHADIDYGNYKSYAKALPAHILNSGLGQSIAMVRSRHSKDNGYKYLYEHLNGWLCSDDVDVPYRNYEKTNKGKDLLFALVEREQDDYIQAQAEALAYLEWLCKFADAFLKDGQGD